MYSVSVVGIKEALYSARDTVDLCERSDAEKTDADSEESEEFREPAPFDAHSFFDVVERAAEAVTVFIYGPVFDCQEAFGEFRGHSEERRDFHPEESSRAAGCDRCRDADDVTCSYCS